MTVAELIEVLRTFQQDAKVGIYNPASEYCVHDDKFRDPEPKADGDYMDPPNNMVTL